MAREVYSENLKVHLLSQNHVQSHELGEVDDPKKTSHQMQFLNDLALQQKTNIYKPVYSV